MKRGSNYCLETEFSSFLSDQNYFVKSLWFSQMCPYLPMRLFMTALVPALAVCCRLVITSTLGFSAFDCALNCRHQYTPKIFLFWL